MKHKKTFIAIFTLALFLLSSSILAASDTISAYLFKGKLIINNQIVNLKQNMVSINGSVYVPIRALSESLKGHVSYDKNTQTIYVEQLPPSAKKSSLNAKAENDRFTLHAFSSQSTYKYGDPLEIWARLSNVADETVNIFHGESLIRYHITDEAGFTSSLIYGFSLLSSSFHAGDELTASISQNDLLMYNLNKHNAFETDSVHTYLHETARPSILPQGKYIISVKVEYSTNGETMQPAEKLEVSLPITIE